MALKINERTQMNEDRKFDNRSDELTWIRNKKELVFRLQKITSEASDARYQTEQLDKVSETYYILDYLIKDAQALRDYIKRNKLM